MPAPRAGHTAWLFAAIVCAASSGWAEAAVPPETAKTDVAASPRQTALNWLSDFQKKQVLFNDREITRIRQKLVDAPPERVEQWLAETKDVRQILDSPEWQETRAWLKEFLKVQAIYSDKELAEFRDKALTGPPQDLKKMLLAIEQQRATIASKSVNSARRRCSSKAARCASPADVIVRPRVVLTDRKSVV